MYITIIIMFINIRSKLSPWTLILEIGNGDAGRGVKMMKITCNDNFWVDQVQLWTLQ